MMKISDLVPKELKDDVALKTRRLQGLLESSDFDAILLGSNANVYYCCGRYYRGYVYIDAAGNIIYLVIKPAGLSGEDVAYVRKPEMIPQVLAERGIPMPKRLGLEEDALSYSEITRLMKVFAPCQYGNCSQLLSLARMVKTQYEISQMKKDGEHQAAAYKRFPKMFHDGMTDVEFQIELEKILRSEGALGFYRTSGNLMELNMGTVLNGDNADAPTPYDFAVGGGGIDLALPAGADGRIMRAGTTVSVDMNGSFNGYQTDMTRTWRIGNVPDIALKAHQCSIRILRTLESFGKPGVACAELYDLAMKIVEEENLQDYFMGHQQKAAFIGHGVGIELNEKPVIMQKSRDVLEKNMTIALEPKFVIPQVGPAGVENTYVVTEEGLKPLTIFPEEMADLPV